MNPTHYLKGELARKTRHGHHQQSGQPVQNPPCQLEQPDQDMGSVDGLLIASSDAAMKSSTMDRASSSEYWTGGDFIK